MGRTNEDPEDDFVTKEEAAQILEKGIRTVYRYIDKGWLKTCHRGNLIGTSRQSVYSLKAEMEREANPYLIHTKILEHRLAVAESRISAMMRMLNLRNEPLSLTDPEAKSLYDMVDYCAKQGWSPHNEETFIDSFMRMRDENLEQFRQVTGDEHPWRPFLMLAGTIRAALFNRALQTDADLAASHLNVLSLMWCKRRGESAKTFDLLVARDAVPLNKLIRRLEREKLKTSNAGEA
jgi:hypothetical protein